MFSINVDISQLEELLGLDSALKKIAAEAGDELSKMAVARAKEKAAEKLHTRRKMYQDGLSWEKHGQDTWMIVLDGKVRWIDDGQTAFDMLKGLLNSPKAKNGKNGKYLVVPFHTGPKGSAEGTNTRIGNTQAQQDLTKAVKEALTAKNIPFAKIEKDSQGNDLMGKLHSFSVNTAPVKQDAGPGQRRGPVGEVMQGSKNKGEKSGSPFLQGVSIHQFKDKSGKTKRSILTFRVATESQGGMAKWEHPGNDAVDILEKAVEEAIEMWQKDAAPQLMDKAIAMLKR